MINNILIEQLCWGNKEKHVYGDALLGLDFAQFIFSDTS